jgi:hypothetical protein
MTLRIIVTSTLHGPEAQIRKTTFETIHRLKNLGVPFGDEFTIVGDPFTSAFVLRFVDDQGGEPDTLYVSEDVKRDFYAGKNRLEINANNPAYESSRQGGQRADDVCDGDFDKLCDSDD